MQEFFYDLLIVLGLFAVSMCVSTAIYFLKFRFFSPPPEKKPAVRKIYYLDDYKKRKPRRKKKNISIPLEAVVLRPEEFSKMMQDQTEK